MKIVRYSIGRKTAYGILKDNRIERIAGTPYRGIKGTGEFDKLSEVKLLAPCLPSKIIAIGLNYYKHAQEVKQEVPKEPLTFFKPSTSVIGPEDKIVRPPGCQQLDYEAELGVVIGKTATRVSKADAMQYVLGYTCFNDVTARDWQRIDKQWTRAKGSDTFSPIGPWIETQLDPGNVLVESYLNGVRKQSSSTNDLVFDVPTLLAFITNSITLLPGDVIATGTPAGIAPMQSGDVIEIKCGGIGTLKNTIA
jgi:2-keto-4-pentenoate hydratase/2-oxohepta-3-ene-1,7-dioic acid hydratase in catechol pathway